MFFAGADNRIRTGDLILTKDVLYLLSHISECFIIIAKECAFVNGFLNICRKVSLCFFRVVEGIDTYAERVCRRRRDRVTPTPTR